MSKLDLKKEYKSLYAATAKPVFVDPVPMNRLSFTGTGDPDATPDFGQAIEALFGVSFAAKFLVKEKRPARDYVVMPLEALWWAEDMSAFAKGEKDKWQWTVFVVQPDFVNDSLIAEAIVKTRAKKDNPALDRLKFDLFHEPHSAQILHVGPYEDEGPAIEKLHEFILEAGHTLLGKHHEIYLSDPRRTAPEKLKTILRQPVKRECAAR